MTTINKVSIACNNGKDRAELELPYSVEIQSSDDIGILIQFIVDLMKKVKELESRVAALELSASINNEDEYEKATKMLKRMKEGSKND